MIVAVHLETVHGFLTLREVLKLACSFVCQIRPALENQCDSCKFEPVWKHPDAKESFINDVDSLEQKGPAAALRILAGIPSAPVALDHASIVLSILKTSSTDSFLKLKWLSAS